MNEHLPFMKSPWTVWGETCLPLPRKNGKIRNNESDSAKALPPNTDIYFNIAT